ncbi:LolA family protein [Asaia astilbis]|uniref:LolA family protein n=1 Tax=Asaia astilbis TaxID=610244 RepID=UPI000B29D4E1|nr:outer membrane lipoprotein carrier protein LolA [Asaia astilbis]
MSGISSKKQQSDGTTMKFRLVALSSIIASFGLVHPGQAAPADSAAFKPAALRPTDAGWIARVQDALNAIHVIKARFQQIAPDGARSTGQAWLERPGKMRFDYDKPSPLLLVANQGKIVYQDRELGQVTTLPLDRTPLGLLLRPDLKLSGDVTVTAFEHGHGLVQVTLVRTATPSEGSLTLIFAESPLTLRSWVVKDAQGRETQIDLFDVAADQSLAESLFALPKEQD